MLPGDSVDLRAPNDARVDSPPPDQSPIYVICDNIRSLFNVGAIFRLADAVRVERLYLCGLTGHPTYPGDPRPPWVQDRAERQIAKTAIHTIEKVSWEYRPSAVETVQELKGRGVSVVALEQTGLSVDYAQFSYRFPLCLVLGHERAGVGPSVLDLADDVVEIPMYGAGTALNVATSFAICAYEIRRRGRSCAPASWT